MLRVLISLVSIFIGPHSQAAGQFFSKEISVLSDAGGNVGECRLGATLLQPIGAPPKAIVLLVHGSGTTDRNERIPTGNTPFKEIAEHLSKEGFATLRFDKRGIQPECRPPLIKNPELSPWHYIRDIRNLVSYIESNQALQMLPVLLLGHSEGVNFVVETALKSVPRLRGLILLAGLGRYAIDETLIRQFGQVLADPLLPEAQRIQIEKLLTDGESFFKTVRSGRAKPTDFYWNAYSKYWSDWISITGRAAESTRRIQVPSLVICGTSDTNITMEDCDALKKATSPIKCIFWQRQFPGALSVFFRRINPFAD